MTPRERSALADEIEDRENELRILRRRVADTRKAKTRAALSVDVDTLALEIANLRERLSESRVRAA